jgi:AraC-like DNA-binding protein
MGKSVLESSLLANSYRIKKKRDKNADFYNGVTQCVLYFNDGRYKIVSSDEAGEFLAVNIVRHNNNTELNNNNTKLNFIERVFKHYKYSNSVNDLSERCGFKSTKTFTRHFKREFNMTPKRWLMLIRKKEVLHYLQNTNLSFSKIASLTGFSNISHLYNFCIDKIESTPAKIRKKARQPASTL